MIKENELRLNNLVMVNYKTDLLSKVTWIQEGSINVTFDRQPDLVNGIVCSVNDLIPIPLTEEWLIKFGFKAINFLNGYLVQEKGYKYMDMIIRYGCFDGHRFLFDFSNEKCVNLKYVHQLQNIYFALTNKELELIKE